jgi:ABC-type transport system involved in cytochrome bd biosynthesis fused ATPase/permease subunit
MTLRHTHTHAHPHTDSKALQLASPSHITARASFHFTSHSVILQPLNFSFPAGQLTVIMGGSGSGKTTLLSLLARHGLSEEVAVSTGRVLFNEKEISAEQWRSVVGYGMHT